MTCVVLPLIVINYIGFVFLSPYSVLYMFVYAFVCEVKGARGVAGFVLTLLHWTPFTQARHSVAFLSFSAFVD